MNRSLAALIAVLALSGFPAMAQHVEGSPYAGMQQRVIAALSESDLAALMTGEGWGLALPAELNGVPGPTHLLELADRIGLTPTQISELTAIRDRMREGAVSEGQRYIAAEQALDSAFAEGPPDIQTLSSLIDTAEVSRAALRFVHLSAHLETLPLLTSDQVKAYNHLRGYGPQDPCDAVPEGHDPDMWRRHNGCDS